MNYYI